MKRPIRWKQLLHKLLFPHPAVVLVCVPAAAALLVWRFMTYYLFLIIGAATTILTHLRGSAKARAAARGSSE